MSSYAQVPQEVTDPDLETSNVEPPPQQSHHHNRDSLRIYYLALVVCSGGLLFGYDSGVIGGVLTFPSFHHSFAYNASTATVVSSIAVGIQQAGALAGCLAIWPITNSLGRRKALMLCSIIFCLGVLLEIINSHSLNIFYIGRLICGLGVGGSATVSPIYLAEMSPSHLRARLGSGYQFTFTIGILVSYWIDYAVEFWDPDESAMQWQVPLALQLVPGLAMGMGMLRLSESVRWLLDKGHTSSAWTSLVWVRGGDELNPSPTTRAEFAEMKRAVEVDSLAAEDFHPRELLLRPNIHRISLAVSLFVAQQATGATAMAYFGPQFFGLLVGSPDASDSTSTSDPENMSEAQASSQALTLLLTGIFGFLKVFSCLFFILFIADRYGRKPLLTFGAIGMAVCMGAVSILLSTSTTSSPTTPGSDSKPSTTTSTLTILLIYTFITIYNLSWGPLPWPMVTEYFPTRLRSSGVAIAVASQWASNFVWSFATPYILRDLGAGTFALFGGVCVGLGGLVWGVVPETRGLSLEGVQEVFDGENPRVSVDVDRGDGYGEEGEREGLVRAGPDDENIDGVKRHDD